jgi:hypothetical protein
MKTYHRKESVGRGGGGASLHFAGSAGGLEGGGEQVVEAAEARLPLITRAKHWTLPVRTSDMRKGWRRGGGGQGESGLTREG